MITGDGALVGEVADKTPILRSVNGSRLPLGSATRSIINRSSSGPTT